MSALTERLLKQNAELASSYVDLVAELMRLANHWEARASTVDHDDARERLEQCARDVRDVIKQKL